MMTGSYHHVPAIVVDHQHRARWRRRLRVALWIGRWLLREAVALFWVSALWAGAVAGLCIALLWGMG